MAGGYIMKTLSTKVNIPKSYFGIEFRDVSLYFYEEEGYALIKLLVNGVMLGRELPIGTKNIGIYGDENYTEENILHGVKEMYPEFFTL